MFLTDLTQGGSFSANSGLWTCYDGSAAVTFPTTTCFGDTLLGGYAYFGSGSYAYRTFTGLTTHSSLTIQFLAFYIDNWEGNITGSSTGPLYDSYLLYVDGTLVFDNIYQQVGPSNSCGANSNDYAILRIVYNITHASSSVTLKFATGLDQGPTFKSFGVSDIQITVCDPTCNTCFSGGPTACSSCVGSRYLSGRSCVTFCPDGLYPDSATNTCRNYFGFLHPRLINK